MPRLPLNLREAQCVCVLSDMFLDTEIQEWHRVGIVRELVKSKLSLVKIEELSWKDVFKSPIFICYSFFRHLTHMSW
jgi:hypothetical protein